MKRIILLSLILIGCTTEQLKTDVGVVCEFECVECKGVKYYCNIDGDEVDVIVTVPTP